MDLPHVPFLDVGRGGAAAHSRCRQSQAQAVRDACLGWLPAGELAARVGDPFVRRWMQRSGSAYVEEIAAIAANVKRPGVWLLHGAYLFGCTALADEGADGPHLRRTLDWPFEGLGRLAEVVSHHSPSGSYLNVTWPGFAGVLTANAPGRFAAAINQAPMRRRTEHDWLLWLDYVLNALDGIRQTGKPPPEHVLRNAFETCRSFDEARRLLETAPVARPVLFTLVGCSPGECVVIERDGDACRTYRDDTVVANAWRDPIPGWRPRRCGTEEPATNNRVRREAMAACANKHELHFVWAKPPVINECTRLTVEMCPASGRVAVMGWEPDGRGSAAPVTRPTTI